MKSAELQGFGLTAKWRPRRPQRPPGARVPSASAVTFAPGIVTLPGAACQQRKNDDAGMRPSLPVLQATAANGGKRGGGGWRITVR